jgi:hypothetical protein
MTLRHTSSTISQSFHSDQLLHSDLLSATHPPGAVRAVRELTVAREDAEWSHRSDGFEGTFQSRVTVDPRLVSFRWSSATSIRDSQRVCRCIFGHEGTQRHYPTDADFRSRLTCFHAGVVYQLTSLEPDLTMSTMPPHSYDRAARAEACSNRHAGLKPHRCKGGCGDSQW